MSDPQPSSSPRPRIDWGAVRAEISRRGSALRKVMKAPTAADARSVLERRAEELARPLVADTTPTSGLEVVAFALAGQSFGVVTLHVRETVAPRDLAALPGLPAFVRGIVNVRSRVLPAFDLRPFLNLPRGAASPEETLLIVTVDGVDFGLLADQILGLRTVPSTTLRRSVPGLNDKYLHGITDDGLAVLELRALFADLIVDDRVEFQTPSPASP